MHFSVRKQWNFNFKHTHTHEPTRQFLVAAKQWKPETCRAENLKTVSQSVGQSKLRQSMRALSKWKHTESNPGGQGGSPRVTYIGEIIIPESVSIGQGAFQVCVSLQRITIPESVTSIGDYAFQNCESLASITIPAAVTAIGNQAFQNCESLASITIPAAVTAIGNQAFQNCQCLASITIPAAVTYMGDFALNHGIP